MAFTTINKSTDYFNTKLYTGNGSSQTITGLNFEPSWVWIKSRSNAEGHGLFDVLRGVTKRIQSNNLNAESSVAGSLESFDSDGFTVGNDVGANGNGQTFASWNWKANGQGSSNTEGSINTTYTSANTTSGFSIIQYTGNATASATIGHGLGKIPTMIIFRRYAQAENWDVYHQAIGNAKSIRLNETGAAFDNATALTSTTPTSNLITLGTSVTTNANGTSMIAYCFADVQGFSKMGSYIGNGNADGTFVYTGFKPAFIILKTSTIAGNDWHIFDSKRIGYNESNYSLKPNSSGVEVTTLNIDLLSNGFKLRGSQNDFNGNGGTYIYAAFAETPFVANSGESIPTTAR